MMFGRLRKSLTLKWMAFSILLATIPIVVAGVQIIQIYQKNLMESIIKIKQEEINVIIERNRNLFEMITSDLMLLTKEEGFATNDLSRIKRHLKTLLDHHSYLVELTFLDERGKEVAWVSKYKAISHSRSKDLSKSEMFEAASKRQFYYKDLFSPQEIFPMVMVAVPFDKHPGKLAGVVSAKIYLRYLWHISPQILAGENDSAYVIGQSGLVVSYPYDMGKSLLNPFIGRILTEGEGVSTLESPQGETYLAVYKPIKELGWHVVVQVPLKEAYAPIKQITSTAVQSISIAFGIAVLVSFLLTRKLTNPIKKLSGEMEAVAKGNLDVFIPVPTQDEIGGLTASFNQMIQDLKKSQGALKEAESKYRNVFENSKDMLYITSAEGKFIDINQAGMEMFGFETREELMNTPVTDLYSDSGERDRFRKEISREGFVKDFEIRLKKKDGTLIDSIITATVRREEDGKIIGYEGTIKNITARKKTEEELVQRTEELKSLNELGSLVAQTLNLDRVLPAVLDKILSLIHFEIGAVYFYDENKNTLELTYNKGYSRFFVEEARSLTFGNGISWRALQMKQPIVLSIDEYPFTKLLSLLRAENIQSLASIPLLSKDKPIGAITLASRSSRILTQREINLLRSIGNQIGLAVENAHLFSIVSKAKKEWETTFDAVTDLITIRDNNFRILRANKAASTRYGLTHEEMMGKVCYEILHRRARPCEGCYVTRALDTRRPVSGERESPYLKGVFQYFTFPIFNEAGEVTGAIDLAREITEQKRLGLEKEVINNINTILASSLDVRQELKSVHGELKRVLASQRMTFILASEESGQFQFYALDKDYEAQELMEGVSYPLGGTPAFEVMKTGSPVTIADTERSDAWICKKLLKEGIRSLLVFPLEYKGKIFGTMSFGSKTANHFSDRHLTFLQQIAPGLAISIQNSLLLEEIKQSEEKYRTVVEGAHDGIAVVGRDFKFKYANKKLTEILGYTVEELVEMDFRGILTEQSKQLVVERYLKWVRKDEDSPHFEFNCIRKDGKVISVEVRNKEMRNSQGELSFVALMRDVTEKKKMEEQLLQSEKLRSLGEMASGVAHDFNNALAAILGNAQLLLYSVQDEEVRESLQTIEKVAKDSAQTVKRLQDFTRRKTHQELFNLDINTIVKDSVDITKPKWKDELQGRGLTLEMILNLQTVPPVEGIASELREVITNLIFNAVEAMPKGGSIEFQTFQRDGKVCVQISDNGNGMDDETKKRIFEPFFTTKPFTNSGLGLSMSYGIIKRLGGDIEVQSSVEQGTTFILVLPMGLSEQREQVLPSIPQRGREARILVIDDEDSVRTILARTLSQVNHQVTVAENGERGIELFKDGNFDLVLTDLGMPGMSGWEVCRMVKGINPRVLVGMITGWGMELEPRDIETNQLDFLISKPFDFNQILNEIHKVLEFGKTQCYS